MIPAPPSRPLPPGARLRPLRAADLEEVARLEAGLFGGEAWSGDLLARELARSGGAGADRRYVVVEEGPDGGGGILGYAGVWLGDGRGDADLLTIATAPRARRRGLAAAMLRELIGLARAAGCRAVLLEVRVSNDAARALYARHGFTTAGRRWRYYTAPVEDALVMRLPLDGGSSEEGRGPSHLSDGGITK